MSLKKSNVYLKSAVARREGLLVSARTSSAVEGIRAPFVKTVKMAAPTTTKAFIAHWQRRVGAIGK